MQNIVNLVGDVLNSSGLVQVEISARHLHLSDEAVEILFGKGASLTFKRELSQPGQFLSEQRVNLIGPKGNKQNVAILGPTRKNTQVELSKSDCISLGISAPIRESGDIKCSSGIIIEGPNGSIDLKEGVIIAKAHIHITPEIAEKIDLKNNDKVMVEILTDRPVILKNVVIRVSDEFRYRMHIDFDEANAADMKGFVLGKIVK